ncbi:Phosphate import ATP-binding protein PstB 1 [Methylacidimicrobium cyclopophantes]|uniref:Phosphate import ATP-binding protein PstB 1 n=1 Tax=Methylacidimicrobium cyclopophantes TaxID=1041766 RepID=A0A5E6MG93_9BACT|nr:phosphate ABC transporter ATP-binding protein PstB [Methylacidimicrobium cyclopophantes]VVM08496.1 Phosphate import ATP-binding protein PstB 1 [Methylacidimicrobium cyclopophantes]
MSRSLPDPEGSAPASSRETDPQKIPAAFQIEELRVAFGSRPVLHGISLEIPARQVTGIIGPSGCGKSTFLRTLNRMHEFTPGVRIQGRVRLFGEDIYDPKVDPILLRRRVGMVFQKSNPFPTMSIQENVLVGLRLAGIRNRSLLEERLEEALRMAALWNEVKDRLHAPGTELSGGQQQRLCIARALAVRPEVLLMDEPCSALDPIATAQIESLIRDLREHYSIVLVTHNLQEAGRTADFTAFFLEGKLIEFESTKKLFTNPHQKQTEDYLTGRYG